MNVVFRKARRLWIVYVAWRKWEGMWGRTTAGRAGQFEIEVSPNERRAVWQQMVEYTSKAPRVFPDRESLVSFLKVLDETAGSNGISVSYGQPALRPEEAVDAILETPADQLTYMSLTAGPHPALQVNLSTAGGWDTYTLRDPRDSTSRAFMPNMSHGSYSVRITGTLILEGERPGGDVSHVAHTLRKFTIDPSKRQLRNLKGNFPLINVDTRQTVREQQFQAKVQRKSAWTGGVVALLVAIGAELVKAAFGGQ